MKKLTIILLIILFLPVLKISAQEEEYPEDISQITFITQTSFITQVTVRTLFLKPTLSMDLSLLKKNWKPWVLPGLGHFDIKQNTKGVIILGLFSCSVISSLSLWISSLTAYNNHKDLASLALEEIDYDKRKELINKASDWYDIYNIRRSWSESIFVFSIITWAYNVFDYYYSLKKEYISLYSNRDRVYLVFNKRL